MEYCQWRTANSKIANDIYDKANIYVQILLNKGVIFSPHNVKQHHGVFSNNFVCMWLFRISILQEYSNMDTLRHLLLAQQNFRFYFSDMREVDNNFTLLSLKGLLLLKRIVNFWFFHRKLEYLKVEKLYCHIPVRLLKLWKRLLFSFRIFLARFQFCYVLRSSLYPFINIVDII